MDHRYRSDSVSFRSSRNRRGNIIPVDLAQAEHENLIATIGGLARQAERPLVHRRGGVVALASGAPLRFFNQVLIEDGSASPEALASAVSLMRETGYSFIVNLRAGVDDRFRAVLEDLDLVSDASEETPGMALELIPRLVGDPGDLDIRVVHRPADLPDHLAVVANGFGMPLEMVEAIIGPAMLGLDGAIFYTGYRDGKPVVSGQGVRSGSTIGVYTIATVVGARRHGYGTALTWRILADGAAVGCTVGTLQASDMGRPVYEAMGFRTVVTYQGFIDREPPVGTALNP